MNETKLNFIWYLNDNAINIELDCTIPLNVGDKMLYNYEGVLYHLKVERRLYIPNLNTLTIVFE